MRDLGAAMMRSSSSPVRAKCPRWEGEVSEVVGGELELESVPGGGVRRHPHAGVVDEQVDAVVRGGHRLGRSAYRGQVGEIQVEYLDLRARRSPGDLGRGVLRLGLVPASEHHHRPVLGEHPRRVVADAGVGPRHHRYAVGLVRDVRFRPAHAALLIRHYSSGLAGGSSGTPLSQGPRCWATVQKTSSSVLGSFPQSPSALHAEPRGAAAYRGVVGVGANGAPKRAQDARPATSAGALAHRAEVAPDQLRARARRGRPRRRSARGCRWRRRRSPRGPGSWRRWPWPRAPCGALPSPARHLARRTGRGRLAGRPPTGATTRIPPTAGKGRAHARYSPPGVSPRSNRLCPGWAGAAPSMRSLGSQPSQRGRYQFHPPSRRMAAGTGLTRAARAAPSASARFLAAACAPADGRQAAPAACRSRAPRTQGQS
jgi:hypothetical protein